MTISKSTMKIEIQTISRPLAEGKAPRCAREATLSLSRHDHLTHLCRSTVRSSFPSSIAAFPRPGAPGSSRGGLAASSMDSEDPLLEVLYQSTEYIMCCFKVLNSQEILDDTNALEQSNDQLQTSYRSNQVSKLRFRRVAYCYDSFVMYFYICCTAGG